MSDRRIDLSVEVPGTPEEVWAAIATGPGISSWFIPMSVEERDGGEIVFDWGGYGRETGRVTAWEPPRRIVYEGEGDHALAYEWLVESRDGGTCVVRLVNSGFGEGGDWDEQFDGMSMGWTLFLENLRLQRTHFAGVGARASIPTVMVPGPGAAAWAALCEAIGVPATLRAGDRFSASHDGVPSLTGIVATARDEPAVRSYAVVLDGPAPGVAMVCAEGDGELVACSVYTYVYADEPVRGWDDLLRARWPQPEGMPAGSAS
jgi:uncharacterized protein YndB with AHSA1/START domain